jgi:hypothetical protein
MSLTSHLASPESPVRQFIHGSAPRLALAGTRGSEGRAIASSLGFDGLTALATQRPIPDHVKNRTSHSVEVGMALDYCIRMDLPGFDISQTAAQRGLDHLAADPDVVHRGKHIHRLLQDCVSFTFLTLKEADSHPLSLARASVHLAWCESIMRAGPQVALTGSLGRKIKRAMDAVELSMSIDSDVIFDIAELHKTVAPLLDKWKQDVAAGAGYTPNPHFLGSTAVGGADADLAIGDTLVDLKTREEITNPWLRETLLQLLGYALLDLDDSLNIRKVGILLPRQPYFAVWTLEDLLGTDAEIALPSLREEFAVLIAEMPRGQIVRAVTAAVDSL